MADQAAFAEVHLEVLRRMHAGTGNPVFAWWAIDWCINEGPRSPLPDWCLDVLSGAARNIGLLSVGKDFRPSKPTSAESQGWLVSDPVNKSATAKIEWDKLTAQVPAAMGFTSRGSNQFRNARSAETKRRVVMNDEQLRKLLGKTPTERREAIDRQLGIADPAKDGSAARAVIREGRRIVQGRRGKPRG